MKASLTKLSGLASLCLLLASCAQTGAPLPPSLELPRPPADLRAMRKGNLVTLAWSEPRLTTDRQTVRALGTTNICRSAENEITECGNPVKIVPAPPALTKSQAKQAQTTKAPLETYIDTLPDDVLGDHPDAEITYAVEVLNRNARGAGLSNRIHVPAIRTMPPPADFAAELNDDGVVLRWTSAGELPSQPGVHHRYRIYRREENGKDTLAGELPVGTAGPAHFLDPVEWEKTYLYHITTVSIVNSHGSEVQVEGDDSPMVSVVAHDIFPPAEPGGLQAAFSGEGQKPFIDLIWAPVPSADLAGYNVYRSEGSGTAIKVNSEPVKTPSYRDNEVISGHTYVYSVSAVDVRGNESARSEETSESVP